MQLARGLRWEIHAIKVWKEEEKHYSTCWGKEEKKQMLPKKEKRASKRVMGLENPGERAAGALAFLGINVTVVLQDQQRHKEPISSRGLSLLLHLFFLFFFSSPFLSYKSKETVVIKSDQILEGKDVSTYRKRLLIGWDNYTLLKNGHLIVFYIFWIINACMYCIVHHNTEMCFFWQNLYSVCKMNKVQVDFLPMTDTFCSIRGKQTESMTVNFGIDKK